MKTPKDTIWHKVSKKLPDKKTNYANKYRVLVLGFDEREYKDSGSCKPFMVSFLYMEKCFYQIAYGPDGNSCWVSAEVTHWAELPKGPI
jgi:Protein of unknown function (DUF551)